MEIREKFIVSIFNYCDRWCETCALTSRCRLFAHATHDLASGNLPLLQDQPLVPLRWLEDVLAEMSSLAGETLIGADTAAREPAMTAGHAEIYERAKAYCVWTHASIGQLARGCPQDPTDPVSVISWFSSLNASKIRHALTGLVEFDGNREFPADHEGAGKVALLGIDRSLAAWQQLVAEGRVSEGQARPCLEELTWMRSQLEAAIPEARSFVRPGFDEPEAMATLLATE